MRGPGRFQLGPALARLKRVESERDTLTAENDRLRALFAADWKWRQLATLSRRAGEKLADFASR